MSRPAHSKKVHRLARQENVLKKLLKAWFPNEWNCPARAGAFWNAVPEEKVEVLSGGDGALKLPELEESANNQMLRKNICLSKESTNDAAFSLSSVSVKLRADNGFKDVKTIVMEHIDVGSVLTDLDDLKKRRNIFERPWLLT